MSRDPDPSRRSLVKSGAALAAFAAAGALPGVGSFAAPATRRRRAGPRVAVVGAGAFGGWSALHLLRQGARVTLLDAWGPGNSRASSGGETRVIRATYGPDRIYVEMAVRSMQLWRDSEKRWGRRLFHETGVLWLAGADDAFEKAALPLLREARVECETYTTAEAAKRYPQMRFDEVAWVLHEKKAGYLMARQACRAVLDAFLEEGGEYRQVTAEPGAIEGDALADLGLSDGTRLAADSYLFACGPWLGRLFPDLLGERIRPTRQEVFFFGTPAGDPAFSEERLPIWIDTGPPVLYGIPGNESRGFKVADDTHGPPVDPTSLERAASPHGLKAVRRYMARRFPAMKDAPLVESRVCQYEVSPDGRFILDRHPCAGNLWIAGGGSGHGFKHGPAIGERVAAMVLGSARPDPYFALSRFAT